MAVGPTELTFSYPAVSVACKALRLTTELTCPFATTCFSESLMDHRTPDIFVTRKAFGLTDLTCLYPDVESSE